MGQRDEDARIVAHVHRLASIARTAADGQILSYRAMPLALQERQSQPETMGDLSEHRPEFEEVREPCGSEVIILSHLLRTYPTPESLRGGGQ